jgi:Uncharacterized protein conserved in bacteria (DUF2188)
VRDERIYHVAFESGAGGGWFVKAAGGRKVFGPYATSDEASAHGDERARASASATGFGRLVVLDAAGWPVTEQTYGSDPRSPAKPFPAEIL